MSNNISAESLFHFMTKREYLEQVLLKNFSPRFCEETILPFFKTPIYIGLKCFCDIPLTLVSNHIRTYGHYSIGFSKTWGKKAGLNPVTYFNENSTYIDSILNAYERIKDNILDKMAESSQPKIGSMKMIELYLMKSFLNFKPITGNMQRENKLLEDVNFYNEREWRYIAKCDSEIFRKFGLEERKPYFCTNDLSMPSLPELNKYLLETEKIDFNYSDINFIILKEVDDIDPICDFIDKNLDLDTKGKNRLKTKLLTIWDLQRNF